MILLWSKFSTRILKVFFTEIVNSVCERYSRKDSKFFSQNLFQKKFDFQIKITIIFFKLYIKLIITKHNTFRLYFSTSIN